MKNAIAQKGHNRMAKGLPRRIDDDVRQERVAAAQDLLAGATPGSLVKGLGVYLGERRFESEAYSIVTLPENMTKKDTFLKFSGHKAAVPLVASFSEALHAVARMARVGGFDGAFVRTETELNCGLANGALVGVWTLPSLSVATGQGFEKEDVFPGSFARFNAEKRSPLHGSFDPISRKQPDTGRVWTLTQWNDSKGISGRDFVAVVKVSDPTETIFAPADEGESPSRACIRPCLALPSAKTLML